MRRTLTFLAALWKANLLAAMEFRIPFITQVIGMMLNNGVYFLFWVIFFDRFGAVRGWQINDMMVLIGVVAAGFGLCAFLFGNAFNLADVIASGRLDYYLSLPRPVLIHVLASRSIASGLGDFIYGLLSFLASRPSSLEALGRFFIGILLSTIIFLSFLVLVQSLAFWVGNAQMLGSQATNAVITFSTYPIALFEGPARFILYTIIPAALIGAMPAEFVQSFSWATLAEMFGAGALMLTLALIAFHHGLRRYESGSAIQTQA